MIYSRMLSDEKKNIFIFVNSSTIYSTFIGVENYYLNKIYVIILLFKHLMC